MPVDDSLLSEFCTRNSIVKLSLFGSTIHNDANQDANGDSDLDILVEFEPGKAPGLLAFADMQLELSQMLGDREVDLRTPQDLSRYFRDEVVEEAVVQYAA